MELDEKKYLIYMAIGSLWEKLKLITLTLLD